MKKETHAKQFIRLFHFYCGKFKINQPIKTIKDNRLDCPCCIDNWDTKQVVLKYHTRRLGQFPKCVWISDIFHEIGHIINNLPYKTERERIYSEYKAEQFAIDMMKKHSKKQYKLLIKRFVKKQTMTKIYKKEEPLYYKAFIKIKEYRDTIK